jgi:phospholipid/cholesterol/gamma-HCH transport system substrate-binding protein
MMPKKINRFKLGLFFLIGTAITLAGLLWAGATHFFQPAKTYVTFFNNSVEGLGPGARVSYLGVKVGRVSAVGIAPDGKLIQAELKLSPDFNVDHMAVELKMKGITGQLYLAINRAPPDLRELTPKITFVPKYPLIPSRPGEMTQIMDALEKVYKKIDSVDFQGLVASWKKTGQEASALLTDKDIQRTIRNLKEISADIKNVVGILGKPGMRQKWQKGFANLADTAAAVRKTSEALATQLENLPPGAVGDMTQQIEHTVFQMNQVLTNLKGMVHELREEPGKILVIPKGKEPFRR